MEDLGKNVLGDDEVEHSLDGDVDRPPDGVRNHDPSAYAAARTGGRR
jgi:hypothetical protein